jgi:hypothetical protein
MTEQTETAALEVEIEKPAPPAFVDPAARVATVDLDYPVTYAGRTYGQFTVRRLSTSEVAAFVDVMRAKSESDEVVRWPMVFDESGQPVPDAVRDAMDDDDSVKLDEAIQRFLPRRFQSVPG